MAKKETKTKTKVEEKKRPILKVEVQKLEGMDPQTVNILHLKGQESINDIYHFHAEIAIGKSEVDPNELLGKTIVIYVHSNYNSKYKRTFTGVIRKLTKKGTIRAQDDNFHQIYSVEIVPKLWFLTQGQDSRIFQDMTVVEIIEKVINDSGIPQIQYDISQLIKTYEKIEYCVQYKESDWNFISRLMEKHGIYSVFIHGEDDNNFTLFDAKESHKDMPGFEKDAIEVVHVEGGAQTEMSANKIQKFYPVHQLSVNECEISAHEFRNSKNVTSKFQGEKSNVNMKMYVDSEDTVYDKDDKAKLSTSDLDKFIVEAENAHNKHLIGNSYCLVMQVGYNFLLDTDMTKYYVTSMYHEIENPFFAGGDEGGDDEYAAASHANRFSCIPADVQYRHPQITEEPMISGLQTATVVTEGNEEITTDKYGRVKVKFHWDKNTQTSDTTCFIRIAQRMAGSEHGDIYIPRKGEEAIIGFIKLDEPYILGFLYNGENPASFYLKDVFPSTSFNRTSIADNKNILSAFSKTVGGGNTELQGGMVDNTPGAERVLEMSNRDREVFVRNDQYRHVENDQTALIEGYDTETVNKDRTLQVGGSEDRLINVDKEETINGMEYNTIGMMKTMTIGTAFTTTVGTAMTTTVTEGPYTLAVPKGLHTLQTLSKVENVTLKSISSAAGGYFFEAGAAKIKIDPVLGIVLSYITPTSSSQVIIGPAGVQVLNGGNALLVDNVGGITADGQPVSRVGDAVGNGVIAKGVVNIDGKLPDPTA